MNGLINEAPQTQQEAPEADQQMGGETAGQGQMSFSDEEIKQVNLIIRQASQVLLDDKNMEDIATTAKQGDPVVAIVQSVLPVLKNVYEAASRAGKQLDMKVMALAGRELIKILVAVLGAAGVIAPEQAGQVAAQAFDQAIQEHNAQVGGQNG